MKHRQFTKKDLNILTESSNWQLICSAFPHDISPIDSPPHQKWLEANSDQHPQQEILISLQGSTVNSLQGISFPVTPGTVLFFDSFEHHDNGYFKVDRNMKHLWLYFVGRKIIGRMYQAQNNQMKAGFQELIIEKEYLFTALQKTWKSVKKSDIAVEYKRKKLISTLELVLLEIIDHDQRSKKQSSSSTYQARIISTIKDHINDSSGKGLTIDRLAHIAGYSKFHFLRIFQQHTGQRVHEYINKVRIKKVEEMLEQGFMKKEISDELGFSCPVSFANWYRKNFKN